MSRYFNEDKKIKSSLEKLNQGDAQIKNELHTKINMKDKFFNERNIQTKFIKDDHLNVAVKKVVTDSKYKSVKSGQLPLHSFRRKIEYKNRLNSKNSFLSSHKKMVLRKINIKKVAKKMNLSKESIFTLRQFSNRLSRNEENASKELNQLLQLRIQMKQAIKSTSQTIRQGIRFGKGIKDGLIQLIQFLRNLISKLMTTQLTLVPILIISFLPMIILMMIPNFISGERGNYNIPSESILIEKDFVFPLPKEFRTVSAHYGY